jgi:ribosomal protein L32
MPIEQARCPECGESIRSHNRRPVDGVTRAENME